MIIRGSNVVVTIVGFRIGDWNMKIRMCSVRKPMNSSLSQKSKVMVVGGVGFGRSDGGE